MCSNSSACKRRTLQRSNSCSIEKLKNSDAETCSSKTDEDPPSSTVDRITHDTYFSEMKNPNIFCYYVSIACDERNNKKEVRNRKIPCSITSYTHPLTENVQFFHLRSSYHDSSFPSLKFFCHIKIHLF